MTRTKDDLAGAALAVAFQLRAQNSPGSKLIKQDVEGIDGEIGRLISAGMSDKELLASFAINRAGLRRK